MEFAKLEELNGEALRELFDVPKEPPPYFVSGRIEEIPEPDLILLFDGAK